MHYDSQLVPFRFTGFDDVSSYGLTLVNNGHTGRKKWELFSAVWVLIDPNVKPFRRGNKTKYVLFWKVIWGFALSLKS